MPHAPGQVRYEVHIQASIPHGTATTPTAFNEILNGIEDQFRLLDGNVTITFARTTNGEGTPRERVVPSPPKEGFL